jgi:hypothetical protein
LSEQKSLAALPRGLAIFGKPLLLTGAFAIFYLVATVSAQASTALQLVYRVSHSVIGDLGSYSCSVEALGNGATQIQSREHIEAKMLGIPLYHMDASDTERWLGNRLVSFYAVTDKAGSRIEIRGEASGNHFIVTSPQGTVTTTAAVHPMEPCAANFLQSTTVLNPDTGGLEDVRVSGGEPTSVTIDGTRLAVRKYILDGAARYTVWLDSRNLPVKFAISGSNGEAIFTLARCVSCTSPIPQRGAE